MTECNIDCIVLSLQPTNLVHDLNLIVEFTKLKLTPPLTVANIPEVLSLLEKKRDELKKDKEVGLASFNFSL